MKRFLLPLVLICTAGCREVILTRLTEREAVDALARLARNGIQARRQSDGEPGLFRIDVGDPDRDRAIELVRLERLPHRPRAHAGLTGTDWSLTSDLKERALLADAKGGDLEAALLSI